MENNERDYMWHDLGLQIVLILVMVFMFLHMHDIPRKLFAKFRLRSRSDIQAKRHFVQGAQHLERARSSKIRSASNSLAEEAVAEAEKAIALDPKDAAAYLLKAMALDLQGFRTSALDSLDMALSPLAVKSLAVEEKGDALLKRAELKMAMSESGLVDSARTDLIESLKLNSKNFKAFCLLGQCYEAKKMKEEARTAYEEALKVEPLSTVVQEALSRLGS